MRNEFFDMKMMTDEKKKALAERLAEMVGRVSEEWLVPIEDIMQPTRGTTLAVEARWVAMYVAVNVMELTRERVGKVFGGRDPSAVSNAVGKVVCRMVADEQYRRRVEKVVKFEI